MARVQFSPFITHIAGSVGNATLQRNQSGVTIRTKPRYKISNSPSQISNRSNLSYLQTLWRSLNSSQQAAFTSFLGYISVKCKHNSDVTLSGYNLFLKHNLMLMSAGASPITDITYQLNDYVNTDNGFYVGNNIFGTDMNDAFDVNSWLPLFKISPPLNHFYRTPPPVMRVLIPTIIEDFELEIYNQYVKLYGTFPSASFYVYYSLSFLNMLMPVSQAPYVECPHIIIL
jgi:hypothetical protein